MEKELLINDESVKYSTVVNADGQLTVTIDGQSFSGRLVEGLGKSAIMECDGKNHTLWRGGKFVGLEEQTVSIESARDRRKKKGGSAGGDEMSSPMPGKILKVMVKAGDTVSAGQGLLVMEAMKMEHTIKAAYDGQVLEVLYKEGDLVDGGVDLVKLEATESGEVKGS